MSVCLFDVFPDIQNKKIVIWGTGAGYKSYSWLINPSSISYFVDSNTDLWGTSIEGIEIKRPDSLLLEDANQCVLFVMSMYVEEIRKEHPALNDHCRVITLSELSEELRIARRQQIYSMIGTEVNIEKIFNKFLEILSSFNYRNVDLSSVLAVRVRQLLVYWLLSNIEQRFPPCGFSYYHIGIKGSGNVLLSFLIPQDIRRDHFLLVESMFQEFTDNELTKVQAVRDLSKAKNYDGIYSFYYDGSAVKSNPYFTEDMKKISDFPIELNELEENWLLQGLDYYRKLTDFMYDHLSLFKNIKVYIATSNIQPEENILLQILKANGVKTAALQHGIIPSFQKHEEKLFDPFLLMYGQLTADELFVWGETSRKDYIAYGLDPEKVKILGNPKYNLSIRDRELLRKHRKGIINENLFAVFCMGPGYNEVHINQRLITIADEIAKKFGMTYIMKVHPNSRMELYNQLGEYAKKRVQSEVQASEVFQQVDFSILCNSTVIVEAMYNYCPAFNYANPSDIHNYFSEPTMADFMDGDELISKITWLKEPSNYCSFQDFMHGLSQKYFHTSEMKQSLLYKEYINSLIGTTMTIIQEG